MTQYPVNVHDTETSSQDIDVREAELVAQKWSRKASFDLAKNEGIYLSDEHWAVIMFLRKHYLELGLPRHARSLAMDLDKKFFIQGGNKYLRLLFAAGPVTQGSRLANLRSPANATDISFGTCY